MPNDPQSNPAPATQQDYLAALLEGASDYIYFKDRDSRFTRINRHMAQVFGFSEPAEAVGKSDFDIFSEEHADSAFQDEQRIMATGIPIVGKTERETWPNGRITWVSSSKMPLRNQVGDIVGIFGISRDVTATVEADQELQRVSKLLVQASRQAGMAEIATGILHNVGNILNSANVSASLVSSTLEKSKLKRLGDVASLINANSADLSSFFTQDDRGKQVPAFLSSLSERLNGEQTTIRSEIGTLSQCLEHIKEIVNYQQDFARSPNLREPVAIARLIDDAIRIHHAAFSRHGIAVRKDIEAMPDATIDKHKLLQILVNLLHNAKYACDQRENGDKSIIVRAKRSDPKNIVIEVQDTGVGIPAENLELIFNHGFTTRKEGHGFGLHSSALAAANMGGTLQVRSDGPNTGATFAVEFPVDREGCAAHPSTSEPEKQGQLRP